MILLKESIHNFKKHGIKVIKEMKEDTILEQLRWMEELGYYGSTAYKNILTKLFKKYAIDIYPLSFDEAVEWYEDIGRVNYKSKLVKLLKDPIWKDLRFKIENK